MGHVSVGATIPFANKMAHSRSKGSDYSLQQLAKKEMQVAKANEELADLQRAEARAEWETKYQELGPDFRGDDRKEAARQEAIRAEKERLVIARREKLKALYFEEGKELELELATKGLAVHPNTVN